MFRPSPEKMSEPRKSHFHGLSTASIALALLLLGTPSYSQPVDMAPGPVEGIQIRPLEEPPRLAQRESVPPAASLAAAAVDDQEKLEGLKAHNLDRLLPLMNGFSREVPPLDVRLDDNLLSLRSGRTAGGVFEMTSQRLIWSARIDVDSAYRLRLHLSDTRLPAGALLWVVGGDEAVLFGPELIHDGGLWSPSVAGPSIHLEVAVPLAELENASFGFTVDMAAELFELDGDGLPILQTRAPDDPSCLVDAQCISTSTFPKIEQAKGSIAHLLFMKGSDALICTGGLINDTVGSSFIPYLLTATRCFSTQASASSLEAFWDFFASTCGGPPPGLGGLPRSNGATMLESRKASDFSLVRLSSIPANRWFMGWNPNPGAVDSVSLHRISHPAPEGFPVFQQAYSRSVKTNFPLTCGSSEGRNLDDLSKYIHSNHTAGEVFPGSSGAPLMLGNGQIVGQLWGACGAFSGGCANALGYDIIDGAFSHTFQFISEYLAPSGDPSPPSGPWLSTPDLGNGNYQVKVRISTSSTSIIGNKESDCIPETLCVSAALPGRSEVFVRVVGPKPNGYMWPTLVKFSTSKIEIWIQQLSTGLINYYLLEGASPGSSDLPGEFDREGFLP